MKRILIAIMFAVMFVPQIVVASAAADDLSSLAGRYDGTFVPDASGSSVGFRIVIDSVDAEGKVKGTVVFYGPFCAGAFQMEGVVAGQDVSLTVLATAGGSAGVDKCDERKLSLRRDGNKLSGRMSTAAGGSNVNVKK